MTQLTIQVPDPHSHNQRLLMNGFNWRGVSEIWIANGTKWGKTAGASSALVTAAPRKPQSLWRWVAPIYTQSTIGYNYCRRMLPGEPFVKKNDSNLTLAFPSIDTRIQFFHGQNPESLEGEATAGNVLDEAAKMKETVYAAVKTTTTVTKGPIIAISTPFGKNWFHKNCMLAKEEMERARFEKRTPTKLFITAPSSDNPAVTPEVIAEAKRSLPDRLFRQYYLAEFVDDGSTFGNFRSCLFGDPITLDGEYQRWYHPGHKAMTVVIGVDWAKTNDRTVFSAIDMATRKVVGIERFYKTPYTEAIRRLVLFSRQFAEVMIIFHDKTGLGNVIDDQLAYTGLPYHGITFTNPVKTDMVTKLITGFEQQSIGLPNIIDLVKEVDAYELNTTPSGLITYGAPSGFHDDYVSSIMLCNLALIQYSDRNMEIMFMDDLKITEPSNIEQYYKSLADEDDSEWMT